MAPLWTRALLLSLVPVAQAGAQSDPCGQDPVDAIDVRPADHAEGVARDAPVFVRYPPGVDLDALVASLPDDVCEGALICMFAEPGPRAEQDGGAGAPARLEGRVQRLDAHTVAFVPALPLRARTLHYPLVARPGFDAAPRAELQFLTGDGRDREPPRLDARAEDVDLAVSDLPEECEAPPGSRRVGVRFPAARDDGDAGSIEYLLHVSRGDAAGAPVLRARARTMHDTVELSFVLPPAHSDTPLCLAIGAVDGVGRRAERQTEICFDPAAGNDFAPLCRVAGAGPGARRGRDHMPTLVLCASMLALVLRGRRGSRARKAGTRRSTRR